MKVTQHPNGNVLVEMSTEALAILAGEIEFQRKTGSTALAEALGIKLGESKLTDISAPMSGLPTKKGTVGPSGQVLTPGAGKPGGTVTAEDFSATAADVLNFLGHDDDE